MPDDSAPDAAGEIAADPETQARQLAAARARLNEIDDQIHALLMERAEVVKTRVGTSGKSSPLRPGRQAAVINRLLGKHAGPLPAKNLVCLWLELMAGGTAIQGELVVAVCETDPQYGYSQITREYFGSLVRVHALRSPAQALAEVSAGRAAIAVLPLPVDGEAPREAWWTSLLQRDDPRIHVIARLPFWRERPAGSTEVKALVVGRAPPDPSGTDRSLVGLECAPDISRARLSGLLEAAGLKPLSIVLRRDPGAPAAQALVEVDGLIEDDEPRLARLDPTLRRPVVLGGYAIGAGGPA
jgi:chorismate mutase/prephenate dehydratase